MIKAVIKGVIIPLCATGRVVVSRGHIIALVLVLPGDIVWGDPWVVYGDAWGKAGSGRQEEDRLEDRRAGLFER